MLEAFDLYSPEIDADPFPYYEILREQCPCYWSKSAKLWIIFKQTYSHVPVFLLCCPSFFQIKLAK